MLPECNIHLCRWHYCIIYQSWPRQLQNGQMLNWILHLPGIQARNSQWRERSSEGAPDFVQLCLKWPNMWLRHELNPWWIHFYIHNNVKLTFRRLTCATGQAHIAQVPHVQMISGTLENTNINVIVGLLWDAPYNGHDATCYGVIPARFQHFSPANLIFLQKKSAGGLPVTRRAQKLTSGQFGSV